MVPKREKPGISFRSATRCGPTITSNDEMSGSEVEMSWEDNPDSQLQNQLGIHFLINLVT